MENSNAVALLMGKTTSLVHAMEVWRRSFVAYIRELLFFIAPGNLRNPPSGLLVVDINSNDHHEVQHG